MMAELDNIKTSMANTEQVPGIRGASSNAKKPLISEKPRDWEDPYVEEMFGTARAEEEKIVLSILSDCSMEEMVILPIYGIGGVGKTTLAQSVSVFNDAQFRGYCKVWVYVSTKLNFHKIGNSIISQVTKKISNIADIQMLQNQLEEQLSGKRIIIVLDDLQEDNPCELKKLKAMLRLGKGRKIIIVTTRGEAIAREMCSTVINVPYKLEIMTDETCWVIIKQKTYFENRPDKKQLEKIGRHIAIKCGGVTLAAQSLGYMLRDMTSDQWESVRDSEIWNSYTSEDPSLRNYKLLAPLRLSYSHIHAWLQSCFSYCAVFPKGERIGKYDLIHQWIALGLVEPSKTFDSKEICERYVRQLLGMSFLQYSAEPPTMNYYDKDATFFMMPDLVYDLARAVLVEKVNAPECGLASVSLSLKIGLKKSLAETLNMATKLMAMTFQELHRMTDGFSEERLLGEGSYGMVYKGVLDNGEVIAVKKLNSQTIQDDEKFKNELQNLMSVQHENIIRLVGYCSEIKDRVIMHEGKLVVAGEQKRALCLEYMQGGTLEELLSDKYLDESLDWEARYKIIKGICQGLKHLHTGSKDPIYHLDLKPANILLDKDMIPKIGDFGLSRLLVSMGTFVTATRSGTLGYMPPEYMYGQEISSKFDVFSLGVIIIQIIAGRLGYSSYKCEYTSPQEFIDHVTDNWCKKVQEKIISTEAVMVVRKWINIALRCVEDNRVKRPTITEIVEELNMIDLHPTPFGSDAGDETTPGALSI